MKEQAPIFRVLKYITVDKKNWNELSYEEQNSFSNYMLNRFISMDKDYCEVVNYVQKNTWRMKGEHLYNLYKDVLPQQYKYFKYIKNQNKNKYDENDIDALVKYYEISKKEAKEYIDMLPKEEVNNIRKQIKGS